MKVARYNVHLSNMYAPFSILARLPTERGSALARLQDDRTPAPCLYGARPHPDEAAAFRRPVAYMFYHGISFERFIIHHRLCPLSMLSDEESDSDCDTDEENVRGILRMAKEEKDAEISEIIRGANGVVVMWLAQALSPIVDIPRGVLGDTPQTKQLNATQSLCELAHMGTQETRIMAMAPDSRVTKCYMCGAECTGVRNAREVAIRTSEDTLPNCMKDMLDFASGEVYFMDCTRGYGATIALCPPHITIIRLVVLLFFWAVGLAPGKKTPHEHTLEIYKRAKKLRMLAEKYVDALADKCHPPRVPGQEETAVSTPPIEMAVGSSDEDIQEDGLPEYEYGLFEDDDRPHEEDSL